MAQQDKHLLWEEREPEEKNGFPVSEWSILSTGQLKRKEMYWEAMGPRHIQVATLASERGIVELHLPVRVPYTHPVSTWLSVISR